MMIKARRTGAGRKESVMKAEAPAPKSNKTICNEMLGEIREMQKHINTKLCNSDNANDISEYARSYTSLTSEAVQIMNFSPR